ncbi:hypothetical protein NC796_05790 [Aliifodinibius sp. S!AR15-10]|uniref:hypothetical protein n=1 Tax=Aliifodinibius sp. S!AR15-10 TaxID=2950437 RepID=UPI002858B568|nr:hypothetical protein [Aliifodinibius sp. S!AR15-10]MDR8390639.1 hypothetical protein [Aliifodinibius sp. S!AR15-10]
MEALKYPDLEEPQSDVAYKSGRGVLREKDSDDQVILKDLEPEYIDLNDLNKVLPDSLGSSEEKNDSNKNVELKRTVQLEYTYKGERFNLDRKNGLIYISHPKWSLVGMGETLLKAEIDMLKDARLIADEYISQSDSELSKEAQKLKQYLLKII